MKNSLRIFIAALSLVFLMTGSARTQTAGYFKNIIPESHTKAGLPTPNPALAGRLARVTDDIGGVWIDSGLQWIQVNNSTIDARDEPFNVKCDGLTDDRSGIASVISVGITYGYKIVFPPGICLIGSNIAISDDSGLYLAGSGDNFVTPSYATMGGTIFRWTGATSGTMFTISGGRIPIFENITFDGNNVTGANGVVFYWNGSGSNSNSFSDWHHVSWMRWKGIGFSIGDSSDHQTDGLNMYSSNLNGNAIGIKVQGGNTLAIKMFGGTISGDGSGTSVGISMDKGGIELYDVDISSEFVNIDLTTALIDHVYIFGGRFEQSDHMLRTPNSTGSRLPISMYGIVGLTTATSNWIDVESNYYLTIDGSLVNGSSNPPVLYSPQSGDISNNATLFQDRGNYWAAHNPSVSAGVFYLRSSEGYHLPHALLGRGVQFEVKTLTYGTTITPLGWDARLYKISVTDNVNFTLENPDGPVLGSEISFDIYNGSGGAMGTITWGSYYKLAGSFTNPADTKHRTITFYYDGTYWIELSRAAADI